MSFEIYGWFAQFPSDTRKLVHLPNDDFDPSSQGIEYPDESAGRRTLATIHWLTQSVLGLPIKPFEISVLNSPLRLESGEGENPNLAIPNENEVILDQTNSELSLRPLLKKLKADDALCVTAILEGATGVEVYATDAEGKMIPLSIRPSNAGQGTAFIGPGIYGLRATGPVKIKDLRVVALNPETIKKLKMDQLATVAPVIDGIHEYQRQRYLGVEYDAAAALDARIMMDAFARANGSEPDSLTLNDLIHRQNPAELREPLLKEEFIIFIRDNFADIIKDPDFTYDQRDRDILSRYYPAKLLQMLALTDPVIATILGYSVTIPQPEGFKVIESPKEIYDAVSQNILPYPLIRIRGTFQRNGNNYEIFQLASMNLPLFEPSPQLNLGKTYPPQILDGWAFIEAEIKMDFKSVPFSTYVDRHDGTDDFALIETFLTDPQKLSVKRPVAYFGIGETFDYTEAGRPTIPFEPLELPFKVEEKRILGFHCRDFFGRWSKKVPVDVTLQPWKIQKPGLVPPTIEYRPDGRVGISIVFSWDWTLRTPAEIKFGLEITNQLETESTILPDAGINLPSQNTIPLSIFFDGRDPQFSKGLPEDWSIREIIGYAPESDGTFSDPDKGEPRSYELQLNLGSFSAIFKKEAKLRVNIAIEGREQVSGDRASTPPIRVNCLINDPRPPVIFGNRWQLEWSSRVDSNKTARAYIKTKNLINDRVAGFYLWRAHESAILELLAESGSLVNEDSLLSEIRGERDIMLRLSMIQGLVEPRLQNQDFLQSFVDLFEIDSIKMITDGGEMNISGAQNGFEFVIVSAVSKTNVPSDKLKLENLDLHAIAVPVERNITRPVLRIIRPLLNSPLESTGQVIAAIGLDREFSSESVRLFWDHKYEQMKADAIIHKIKPVSEIKKTSVEKYAPQAIDIALNGLFIPYWRYFVVNPPQTWAKHNFTADICSQVPPPISEETDSSSSEKVVTIPSEEIASPRAEPQSLRITPSNGPILKVSEINALNTQIKWTVECQNVFDKIINNDEARECEIQIDVVNNRNDKNFSDPQLVSKFSNTGEIKVGEIKVKIESISSGVKTEIIAPLSLKGKIVRLAASDPIGRITEIFLKI